MAPRARGRIVTLTSDVGAAYSAQMKAVLARSIDIGRVVELAHDLPAHGVAEAAFLLRAMARGFPPGTVHVAVVDPGVGGQRAALVIECADGSLLVGPDNGLLVPLAEALGHPRAYALAPRAGVNRGRVGTTFDGRDLFAPVAARLARGARPARLGRRVRPVRLSLPTARRTFEGGQGEVVHVDRFGNLITDLPTDWVPPGTERLRARLPGGRRIVPWVASYDALPPRSLGAIGSSFGTVELFVREGRAADRLSARTGTTVAIDWTARGRRGRIGK